MRPVLSDPVLGGKAIISQVGSQMLTRLKYDWRFRVNARRREAGGREKAALRRRITFTLTFTFTFGLRLRYSPSRAAETEAEAAHTYKLTRAYVCAVVFVPLNSLHRGA